MVTCGLIVSLHNSTCKYKYALHSFSYFLIPVFTSHTHISLPSCLRVGYLDAVMSACRVP